MRDSRVGVMVAVASVFAAAMEMNPAADALPNELTVAVAVEIASMRTSPATSSSTGSAYALVVVAIVASATEPEPAVLITTVNALDDAVDVVVTEAASRASILSRPVLVVSFEDSA